MMKFKLLSLFIGILIFSGLVMTVNAKDIDSNYVAKTIEEYGPKPPMAPSSTLEDTEATLVLELNQGWNLISLPLNLSDMSVESVLPDTTVFSLNPSGSYEKVTEIEPCEGYWVLSRLPDRELSFSGPFVESCNLELQSGWNMVGIPYSSVLGHNILRYPEIISGYTYNGEGYEDIIASESIDSSNGVFLKVNEPMSLVLSSEISESECVSPESGMILIEDTTFCEGTYELSENIYIQSSDITLDCNGANLVASGSANGIVLKKAEHRDPSVTGVTVQNCNLEGFFKGILLHGVRESDIIDNTISDCDGYGIELIQSSYNTINDNEISDSEIGIRFVFGSHYNQVIGNTASNNFFSNFHFISASDNEIRGNTASGRSDGVHIIGYSDNNQVVDNVFCDSSASISILEQEMTETYIPESNYGSGNTCNRIVDEGIDTTIECTYECP